jgi:hypothetical protein
MEEFPVSKGALAQQLGTVAQQLGTVAPMAAIGGIAGATAGEEAGVNPLVAGLAGTVLGGAAGSAAARFARLAPMSARRGVLDLGTAERLKNLGVKDVGFSESPKIAKRLLLGIGVDARKIAQIADDATPEQAYKQAYKLAIDNSDAFKSMSKTEISQKAAELKLRFRQNGTQRYIPNDGVLDAQLSNPVQTESAAVVKNGAKRATTKNTDSTVSPALSEVGMRPVPRAADSEQYADLYRAGDVQALQDAAEVQRNNIYSLVDPRDLPALRERKYPIFYSIYQLLANAKAAGANMPLLRYMGASGAASAQASPLAQEARGGAALVSKQMKKLAESKEVPSVPAYGTVSDSERRMAAASGAIMNTAEQQPSFVGGPFQAVAAIINDPATFLRNPTSVSGIKQKVAEYLYNIMNASSSQAAVMDSWMMRSLYGNIELGTAGSGLGYKLAKDVFSDAARQLGVRPSVLQEYVWQRMRILGGDAATLGEDAFEPLTSQVHRFPGVSRTAPLKSISEKLPDFETLAKQADSLEDNDALMDALIDAIEQEPELAAMLQLRGGDVVPTESFLRRITEPILSAPEPAPVKTIASALGKASPKAPATGTGPVLGMSLDDALGKAPAAKKAAAPKKGADLEKTRSKMEELEKDMAGSYADGITQEAEIKYLNMLKDKDNPLHDVFRRGSESDSYLSDYNNSMTVRFIAREMRDNTRLGVPREFAEKSLDAQLKARSSGLHLASIRGMFGVDEVDRTRKTTSDFFKTAPRSVIDGLLVDDQRSLDTLENFMSGYDGLFDSGGGMSLINDLSPAGKETFWSLLPEWDGSMLDLIDVAKSLSA